MFTPAGELHGFLEKIPEDEPGAALQPDAARLIAEEAAVGQWQIDLDAYELVEPSQELRPGGRIDHTLVYEHPRQDLGDGRYRLRLTVSGDKLTEVTRFIKIPEGFERRYEEMRSANNTIGVAGSLALLLVYLLGGCVVGLFVLLRKRWVLWRQALSWGIFVSLLQALVIVNQWPLAWMGYDTALSVQGHFLRQLVVILVQFVGLGILLTLSFMAAESLTRRAFPHHIQLWRSWSAGVANSPSILGRTVAGYLLVSVFFAYEVSLYFFTNRFLGWWSPSDALFQPDILANYFPWFSSIAISLQAGFWEECLFRAVPIACAALLGQRFGRRRLWIAAALVIQALIFGAGHAPYPTQPAYARVVELIIPSLFFGGIYICLGLLPAIVLHFAFDVVWFAIPLFVSKAPGVWVDQVLVILLALLPLVVVLARRWRAGSWRRVSHSDLNGAWMPDAGKAPEPEKASQKPPPMEAGVSAVVKRFLPVVGLVGLVIWILATDFQDDAPPLDVSRSQAIRLARQHLSDRGFELPETWEPLASVQASSGLQHRFVWRTGKPGAYEQLMGDYLTPPHWRVRFARFEGDVEERAEEYRVFVGQGGEVLRFQHRLPES